MTFQSDLRYGQWPSQSAQPWTSSPYPAYPLAPAPVAVRTAHPFAKAIACAAIVYAVATCLLLIMLLARMPQDATPYALGYATGQALGYFFIASFLPALVAGLVARLSARIWPAWQITVLHLALFFLVVALQLASRAVR